ncbi:NAD(P)-dependent oxidoreductase [Streptomyces albidochromogenes]|uniref:NAD(P)-dependent oxidoreductase n=1 Tax=Streptomyces albidochromogenes TaxID=329524 RepID=UPI00110FD2AD|nr:NAD(P)H-binding protein [Streptomyces albidochromogenes]
MEAKSSRIIVFGAGGTVGRAAVAEARRRGHEVTTTRRADGDVTDPAVVARLAAGHDAAIVAVYDPGARPGDFFPAVARALAEGLPAAGVKRLVSVGLASVLPTASGEALMDTPGYPQEWREFYLGHGAGTEALRAAAPEVLDWAVLSPAGDFDHEGEPSGGYALAPAVADSRITPGDFARALLDEVDIPTLHGTHAGVSAV